MQLSQHLTTQLDRLPDISFLVAAQPLRRRPETMLVGMKKWLAWLIVGGPVVVYAIGKLLSH